MILDIQAIKKILPHRYPFLLVDRITELDLENSRIVGQKNITVNESFFEGHFPMRPVMPGVLILEAMAQTGGILIHQKGYQDKIAFLLTIDKVKYRHMVVPGDVLMMHVEGRHLNHRGGKVVAQAFVGEKLVAEASIAFVLQGVS